MEKLLYLLMLLSISSSLLAQDTLAEKPFVKGSIRGKVIEAETGEGIIGAQIMIKSTGQGSISDLDGNFVIPKVDVGIYDLECSYLGFQTQRIVGVRVTEDRIKLAYFRLNEGAEELGINVIVTADAANHLEAAMLAQRKKSSRLMEALSSEEIFRSGDYTIAEAAKRFAGTTVESDRFLYVRGLGGRYVKVLMNGQNMAHSDLTYSGLDLSVLPASLVDNITLYKSFSADMSGNFAGGALNIVTKSIPDKFQFKVDIAFQANTSASFQKSFLTYQGKADWIAGGNSFRELPVVAAEGFLPRLPKVPTNAQEMNLLNQYTSSFWAGKDVVQLFSFRNSPPPPDMQFGISLSNQKELGKKANSVLGYGATISYSNSFWAYQDGLAGRYQLTDANSSGLTGLMELKDSSSTQVSQWAVLFNLGLKINKKHHIKFLVNANRKSTKISRILDGTHSQSDSLVGYNTQMWRYDLQSYFAGQLSGDHDLGIENLAGSKMVWNLSASNSQAEQPDLRTFSYSYSLDSNSTPSYSLGGDASELPGHYFRLTQHWDLASKVGLILPFSFSSKLKAKFSFGGQYSFQLQDFREERYFYSSFADDFNGNINDYLSPNHLLSWNTALDAPNDEGIHIYDAHEFANNFKGKRHVISGYGQTILSFGKKLKLSTGLRYEHTITDLENERKVDSLQVENEYGDFLPFLTLNYYPVKDMVLRLAGSRTTTRPTFRELTVFASFDYIGDYLVKGNPKIDHIVINNFDIRWEWFPALREIIAFGGFFKYLQQPIERIANIEAPTTEITFQNSADAWLVGGEFEFRKSFDFLGDWGKDLYIGANFSYIYSQTKIDATELAAIHAKNPNAADFRPLFGQAPYTINANLGYRNDEIGTLVNVSFNMSGKRLVYVMRNGTPDIYELPRATLDVNVTQKFAEHFQVRVSARNLLNAPFQQVYNYNNQDYYYRKHKFGQTFLIGFSYFIH